MRTICCFLLVVVIGASAKAQNPNLLEKRDFLDNLQGEWDVPNQGAGATWIIAGDKWFEFQRGNPNPIGKGKILVKENQGTIEGYINRQDAPYEVFLYSAGPTAAAMTWRKKGEKFDNEGRLLWRSRTIEQLKEIGFLPIR